MSSIASEATRTATDRSYTGGLVLALVSASSFGLSGSLARSLLDLGWSPAAVVATRVGGAFLILLIPTLLLLRRIGLPTGAQSLRMLAYGVVAVALAQLCYFSAVQYLSVGVALLLEFLAPVMLIGWHWARNHRRPAWSVLLGAGLSILGLAFVLDLRDGLTLNPIGVAWGLGAALCLCAYFLLSEDNGTDAPIHPLLLTTAGTGIGAAVLLAAAAAGILPLAASGGVAILGRPSRRLVASGTFIDLGQRSACLPQRHRRSAPPRQLAGIVRGVDRGDLRSDLRFRAAGAASRADAAARWCVDLGGDRPRTAARAKDKCDGACSPDRVRCGRLSGGMRPEPVEGPSTSSGRKLAWWFRACRSR